MTLKDFFEMHPKTAIAFSGGVDSAFLLYEARKYAKDVMAYYVKSVFQPEFEYEDAKRFTAEYDIPMSVIRLDVLSVPEIKKNPANRCYFCKKKIFSSIAQKAREDGYDILLDGTNASDSYDDRPGMKALQELKVLSPLRSCGLTKEDIRKLSKEAGLFTWNKPAYACLATRVPTGTEITASILEKTEVSEGYLFSLGFSDFRVRLLGDAAKIQIPENQMELLIRNRKAILNELKKYYKNVYLDMEARDEH